MTCQPVINTKTTTIITIIHILLLTTVYVNEIVVTLTTTDPEGISGIIEHNVILFVSDILILLPFMNIQFTEELSSFSFSTLNCNGFKSSIDYIDYLSFRYDINFVCETWLRAVDICNIQEYSSHKWCHFVTSMNPGTHGKKMYVS